MPSINSIYAIESLLLTNIASAIRTKTGSSSAFTPAQMASEILNIPGGGFDITSYIGYEEYARDSELINYIGDECFVESRAFASCSNLLTASLSKCVLLRSEAFRNCSSLLTVNLPQCVHVMSSAFVNCTSLKEVFLPDCLCIEENVFTSCSELETIDIHNVFSFGAYGLRSTKIQSISLDNCYELPMYGFANCPSLSIASFPKCKQIDNFCFSDTGNLKEIYAPECEIIGQNAFSGCVNLLQVDFPKLSYINGSAFYRCLKLSTVSIGSLISSCLIANSAFLNCSSLTSLYILCSTKCSLGGSSAFRYTPLASRTGHIYVPSSLYSQYYNDATWSWFRSVLTSY